MKQDPKNQRPEMWRIYSTRINRGDRPRLPVNWTELDIWQYILQKNIPTPLYLAKNAR